MYDNSTFRGAGLLLTKMWLKKHQSIWVEYLKTS